MDGAGPLPGVDGLSGLFWIALSIVGVAFFASSEAAIGSLSKLRVRTLAEGGKPDARALERLTQSRERLLGTLLLGQNALTILAAIGVAVDLFDGPSGSRLALFGGMLALTFAMLFFGQVLPRSLATQNAERYALFVARPLEWVSGLLTPFMWVFTGLMRLLYGVFGIRKAPSFTPVTEEDLQLILADVQEQGVLAEAETEMIQSVITLGETACREIMVPRIDMCCLPVDATYDEALALVLKEGHSRIPIYQDSSDNIIGVLYVKDLLAILQSGERPEGIPSSYIRPAYHVPESKKVDALLKDMRTAKVHMAIVLDEFGGTAGLITIEDILEEIVGEIQDEYDAEEDLAIQHQPDGSLVVEGRVPIDDVSDLLGIRLPTEDFDTIGGFVMGLLGRAPNSGEEVSFESVGLRVEEVEQRRIARLRVWRRDTRPLPSVEGATWMEPPRS